jgi:small subunit ribosomal protein S5
MQRRDFRDEEEFEERVVDIARMAKVVKGGRRFNFRTVCVVGDRDGQVGMAIGKARDVAGSIRKGMERARKDMISVPLAGTTIPHRVVGKVGAAEVLLKPAPRGTGVIAGSGVRAVLEACGIQDVSSKSLGSANVLNVTKATLKALTQLKDIQEEARRRGKTVEELGYGRGESRG